MPLGSAPRVMNPQVSGENALPAAIVRSARAYSVSQEFEGTIVQVDQTVSDLGRSIDR